MTETMMKLIEEMKALEATLVEAEKRKSYRIHPMYQSTCTFEEVNNLTEELYPFHDEANSYEVGYNTSEIKYA